MVTRRACYEDRREKKRRIVPLDKKSKGDEQRRQVKGIGRRGFTRYLTALSACSFTAGYCKKTELR